MACDGVPAPRPAGHRRAWALREQKASFRDSWRWTVKAELPRSSRGSSRDEGVVLSPALPNDEVPGAVMARGLAAQLGLWPIFLTPPFHSSGPWPPARVVPPRAAAEADDCTTAARGIRRPDQVMARGLGKRCRVTDCRHPSGDRDLPKSTHGGLAAGPGLAD